MEEIILALVLTCANPKACLQFIDECTIDYAMDKHLDLTVKQAKRACVHTLADALKYDLPKVKGYDYHLYGNDRRVKRVSSTTDTINR